MSLKVTKSEVWAAETQDEAGGLAKVLEPLAAAGANLDCLIARRQPDKPGTGVVFVTPVKGKKIETAAQSAGLRKAEHIATLRVEAADQPGLGAKIARAVGNAGVNMRGFSAAVIGNKCVAFLGFDSEEEADQAAKVIKLLGRRK